MNAISVPFLPTGLWLFATAGCILVLVLVFGMYWYWRDRFQSTLIDSRHVAELASRKEQLQADVTELRNWITEQKNELLRLKSDREEQEQIGKEITRLQNECANAEYRLIESRKETGELESQRHSLSQSVERLSNDIKELDSQKQKHDDLNGKITEAQKNLSETDEKLTSVRKEFDFLTRQIADRRIVLNALNSSHENLSGKIIKDTAESDRLTIILNQKDEELKKHSNIIEELRQQTYMLTRQTAERRIELDTMQIRHEHLSKIIEQLAEESNRLTILSQELNSRIQPLNEECARLDHELNHHVKEKESLKKESEHLTYQISERRIELDALNSKHENLSKKIIKDTAASDQLSITLNQHDEELKEKRNVIEDLRHQADALTRQTAERRIELDTIQNRHEQLSKKIEAMTEESDRLKILLQDLNTIIQPLKDEYTRLDHEKNHLLLKAREDENNARETIRKAEREVQSLVFEKNALLRKINELSTLGGQDVNVDPYADLLQIMPECLVESNLPTNKFPNDNEEHALNEVRICLEKAGYQFHERVIKSFHTALKCQDINPLTVLAGVSGTGKTLLPTVYAHLMGMHSLVIAVQPRWDSPQDMFGFYNYLENRYKATDLARALIRMNPSNIIEGLDKNHRIKDRMLLILLDEMNLARTEYYFSEFLSKLELRSLSEQHSKILLDTGPGREKPISFRVERNVLFTGTMNEDETTQTLSDKVLDRANILRFGKPAKRNAQGQTEKLPNPPGYLMLSQWMNWCRSVEDSPWFSIVQDWIDGLNDSLTKVGRPFGHRVQLSMQTYVSNYPGVNGNNVYKIAFADQIEQKILPKLRGLETSEGTNNAAFDEIGTIIQRTGDQELHNAFNDARQNNTTGMFIWQGVTR